VLINLLSNAVKYNRPKGAVRVECVCVGGHARIDVVDTGMGIAVENRERIFSPFDRLGAERGQVQGAGIGLVITRRIVEAMGGEIGFDSTVGVGTVFHILLPLAERDPSAGGPQVLALAPTAQTPFKALLRSGSARVLYVEDNVVNARIMEHILGALPQVEFELAETAEEGLQRIRRDPPDLVLMDIHLPGMSGLDALRLIKGDPRTASLPVIAVSAAAMGADVREGLDAGFLCYLTKPFNVEQLLQVVVDTLNA
jgi:CheY-like chemotaxis protein